MFATLATFTALALAQQTDTQIAVRPGTRLEVNNYGGGIVVKAWSQNAVRVHAEHSSRDYVDVTLGPSTLVVRASSRGGAGYVSLKSVEGAIALQEAKGRVEVNTVNEDVTLTDISGDITAETVSGGIELEGIESANVDVSTVSGDVLYQGTIKDAGHYRFSTHNGDVTLAVPEKTNATISVATFNGDFASSFPVSVTGTTKHRFGFTIGSGSARIDLETFNGDIRLRRPGQLHEKNHNDHEEDH